MSSPSLRTRDQSRDVPAERLLDAVVGAAAAPTRKRDQSRHDGAGAWPGTVAAGEAHTPVYGGAEGRSREGDDAGGESAHDALD